MPSLTIYETCITPSKNMGIDDIEQYLYTQCPSKTYSDILAIKPAMTAHVILNDEIPTNLTAGYNGFKYNYAKYTDDNGNSVYYFINNYKYRGSNNLELELILDTINSFFMVNNEYYNRITDKTMVLREHRNRFEKLNDKNGNPIYIHSGDMPARIDEVDEGIRPVLRKVSSRPIESSVKGKWWLLYRNTKDITPTDYDNPIECCLVSDLTQEININHIELNEFKKISTDKTIQYYFMNNQLDNANIYLNVVNIEPLLQLKLKKYDILCFSVRKTPQSEGKFIFFEISVLRFNKGVNNNYIFTEEEKLRTINLTEPNNIYFEFSGKLTSIVYEDNVTISHDYNHILSMPKANINITPNIKYSKTLDNINRSDPKNIKLISLPYCPVNNLENESIYYDFNDEFIKLCELQANFKSQLLTPFTTGMSILIENARRDTYLKLLNDPYYETKLLHSSFFENKLVYCENAIALPCELLKCKSPFNNFTDLIVEFKPTNTINSNILFSLKDGFSDLKVSSYTDFTNVMTLKRNNEEVLYNSAYINYVKNGYNYDKKRQALSITTSALGTATQGITAGAAMGKGITQGDLTLSAGLAQVGAFARNLMGTINNAISSEMNIKEKLEELKNQNISINGSDDIDLIKEYCDNKAYQIKKAPSNAMQQLLAELFYYTGYRTAIIKKPNLNSRIWFNYIQAKVEFSNNFISTIKRDYLDNIQQRIELGLTIYHHNIVDGELTYDFKQEKENWEENLIDPTWR